MNATHDAPNDFASLLSFDSPSDREDLRRKILII